MAFSRDGSVAARCVVGPQPLVCGVMGTAGGAGPPCLVPPCGVLPHAGMAALAAPLVFIYDVRARGPPFVRGGPSCARGRLARPLWRRVARAAAPRAAPGVSAE